MCVLSAAGADEGGGGANNVGSSETPRIWPPSTAIVLCVWCPTPTLPTGTPGRRDGAPSGPAMATRENEEVSLRSVNAAVSNKLSEAFSSDLFILAFTEANIRSQSGGEDAGTTV